MCFQTWNQNYIQESPLASVSLVAAYRKGDHLGISIVIVSPTSIEINMLVTVSRSFLWNFYSHMSERYDGRSMTSAGHNSPSQDGSLSSAHKLWRWDLESASRLAFPYI